MRSLGFVEVSGVVAAVDALDIMCKTASVNLVTWERKLGGRLVTMIIEGSVSDVREAVEAARENCIGGVKSANVIANPHEETIRLVELSASRLNKKKAVAEVVEEPAPQKPATPKKTTTRKPKANG
ncbi:MAG: BMC domain-containing protein [Clostridiales bacterium]|nr:BMC domain-containing protein [Clostridiales bacterium]